MVTARREVLRLRRAVAMVERGGRVLVERREGELLGGLWEPPGVELEDGQVAGPALRARLRALGIPARLEDTGTRVKHTITHRRIEVEVWRATPIAANARGAGGVRWVKASKPGVALTALAQRLIDEARD